MKKNTAIAIIIICILAITIGVVYFSSSDGKIVDPGDNGGTDNDQVFCTLDAKECPDGSYVGRTGPNCEFTACPGQ